MDSISIKLKRIGVLILALLLTFLRNPPVYAYLKSIITPDETNYLGIGFNSISESFIYDNTCLKFSNIETETVGGVSNTSYYCFVNSKEELRKNFSNDFSVNTRATPNITAKSRVTDIIVNNTSFSADKITLFAYWKQEEKKIFSNDLPVMSDEALSVLKADPKRFFQLYGDKYISSVTLGKMFFIVYQADISKYSSYSTRTKNAIKQAMELSLKKILGAKLTSRESAFVSEKLADITINSNTYGNDIADFVGPYSAEDFKNILKKNSGQSAVIASELKDYSFTYNRYEDDFYNISEYLAMAKEWNKHLSHLDYIISNSRVGFNLISDCRTALDNINAQLRLVNSLDSDARFPSAKEIDALNGLYYRYINEMQVAPRTYYMPAIEKKLDVDLSNLNDVETIKISCSFPKEKMGFGSSFSKPITIFLYIVDEDGNWCELKNVPINKMSVKTPIVSLYEGIKFCDKFRIGFSDPKIDSADIKILVSFTEKVDDIIWLLVKEKADKK